jgi:uncharacterized membrane-anchored protein
LLAEEIATLNATLTTAQAKLASTQSERIRTKTQTEIDTVLASLNKLSGQDLKLKTAIEEYDNAQKNAGD